ncbi:MAG TPA: TrmH family RNA methyltransferase [Bacteroidetes bacterium]|nr:TrmH family RNA methyltransferase [Bacteroidota bacterium]
MNTLPSEIKRELIEHLSGFISEKRYELLKFVLSNRTRYLTVVLEDIYQSQNASAVLRSCDCFGVQDIHIIENTNEFNINPKVVMGSTKWLNICKYNKEQNNTLAAIRALRKKGYRIVATSPHTYQTTLNDFNIEKGKFALFFGTELSGLSADVLNNADEYMLIPTYGFTESLNISVSAAICLHTLSDRLRNSNINYLLSASEKDDIMHEWLRLSIRSWRSIEKRFLSQKNLMG